MPQKPNKLTRFWQELKRRRVIHVITVYATTAFVIIELVGNLAEPLNLPSILQIIVIIVLAVGFPMAIILSWIYDLTSRGIEKTKPLSDIQEGEKRAIPNAWKIATIVSFAVIIGLVTFNIVRGTRGLRPGNIESLAILPFDNFTGDEQLDWVAAGMHSTLIGDMGRVSGLRVLGKTTSNAYKETKMTAADIARKHNVDALVEPTLTCYGDMVCIQVRVITPYPEEKLLWVEDYMEDKSQILNLYNRITRKIANELKVNLSQQEESLLAESRIIDPAAYDAYLAGRYLLDHIISLQSLAAAIDSFKKAIELEPDWAAPYAGMAEVGADLRQSNIASESDIIMMYENLNRALALDPNSAEAHHINAGIAVWTEFDWEKGEKEYLRALELNPNYAYSHIFYAHLLTILRRTDEAIYHGKKAVELDPENPFILGLYGVILVPAGKCQEALYTMEKALSIDPDHAYLQGKLHNIYLCLGEYEKAFEAWKNDNADFWDGYGITESLEKTFHEQGWRAFIRELTGYNQGIMAEYIGGRLPFVLYQRYFQLGEFDKAVDYLEIAFRSNKKFPEWPYLSEKDVYDKLKGDPRYLAILKEMNLPVSDE